MCKVMEDMRTEKEIETRIIDIKNIMESLKMTVEQAMDALKVPQSDRSKYLARI